MTNFDKKSAISVAALIMAKNEQDSLKVTLESIKNQVDGVVLFDTGSTDNTIDVVRDVTKKNKLKFHLLTGKFEDFSTSRNKLLEFANKTANTEGYDFFLLLDANDELRIPSGNTLKDCLKSLNPSCSAFLVKQEWFVGLETSEYYNVRLIKSKQNFKFEGVVHEYLKLGDACSEKSDKIVIYQDRTKGASTSCERWKKDVILLEKELKNNPTDGRTQYYLAQTYDCLNMKNKAKKMYTIRAKNNTGFQEERFISMMRIPKMRDCNEPITTIEKCEEIKWYFSAYFLLHRAEPLVELSKLYRGENALTLAYSVAKLACELEYPEHSVFLVNQKCYNHDRWHELGISAYYVGQFEEGKKACLNAIASGFNTELNVKNLQFYLNPPTLAKKDENHEKQSSET